MSDALDNPFVFSLHRGAKVPLRKQTIKHRDHQIYGKGRDAAPEAACLSGSSTPKDIEFTGVWREQQEQYSSEDPHDRAKFLVANLSRIKAKLFEREIKKEEAEAAGSLPEKQQTGAEAANTTEHTEEVAYVSQKKVTIAQLAELR